MSRQHDPLAMQLSAADDRVRLSKWLPPQTGVVPRIRIAHRCGQRVMGASTDFPALDDRSDGRASVAEIIGLFAIHSTKAAPARFGSARWVPARTLSVLFILIRNYRLGPSS